MNWEKDANESRRIWPHDVFERLRVDLHLQVLKGGDVVDDWRGGNVAVSETGVADAQASWQLYALESDWDSLAINASIDLADAVENGASCHPTGNPRDACVALLAECPRTQIRTAAICNSDEGKVSAVLRRDDLAGTLSLAPLIALNHDYPGGGSSHARTMGAIIATGFGVEIQVDEPLDRPGRGLLRKWTTFPESESNSLWKLDFLEEADSTVPVLYFNSRHATNKAVIDFTGRRSPQAQERDSLYSLLATEVWMSLAAFAASTLEEGADIESSRTKLAGRVAETLRRRAGISRDLLGEAASDDASRSEVSRRIQHWLNVAPKLASLVDELEQDEG